MAEAANSAGATPQGWHDDDSGQIRWWDGQRWTQHVQPLISAAAGRSENAKADLRAQRDATRLAEASSRRSAREAAAERRNAERKEKDAAGFEVRQEKKAAKDAKQAQTEAARAAKIAEREAELAAWDELTGPKIFQSSFGLTTIALYEKGYACFGATVLGMASEPGAPEKLLGAKTTTHVQDKSTGGRAVAAGLTMGVSLLASNEKRLIFLTLTTDKQVRVLKGEGDMMRMADKAAMEIVARAEALIEQSASLPIAVRHVADDKIATTEQLDLFEKIKRLAELRDAGILSGEEFEAKKAELLSRI